MAIKGPYKATHGQGEATSQHHHRGQQTLRHEVTQARGAVGGIPLSIYPSTYPPIHLSIYLPIYLATSIYSREAAQWVDPNPNFLFICASDVSTYPSTYLPIHPSTDRSTYAPIYIGLTRDAIQYW